MIKDMFKSFFNNKFGILILFSYLLCFAMAIIGKEIIKTNYLLILSGIAGGIIYLLLNYSQTNDIPFLISSKMLVSLIMPFVIVSFINKTNLSNSSDIGNFDYVLAFAVGYSNDLITHFLNRLINHIKNILNSVFPTINENDPRQ